MLLDVQSVQNGLARLAAAKSSAFGWEAHRFRLNPPAPEAEVKAFETEHSVSLPADYRHFLTHIGNGGAGPTYGVFPLGMMDGPFGFHRWREVEDGLVGVLSQPFPLEAGWNDLTGKPSPGDDEEAFEQFDNRYWSWTLVNGAIPICHTGCAVRIFLVVTGSQAGSLWYDKRAEFGGLMPLMLDDGTPQSFASWYQEWLDVELRKVQSAT